MRLPERPFLSLVIDLNDGCNLKCVMCGPRANKRDQKVLPLPFFRSRIAPIFRHVADFQLGCTCEPLMLPYLDEALALIGLHRDPDTQGQLITNGTLLTDATIDTLLESGVLAKIRISIDGATATTYESIRKGGRFDQVCERVGRLCARRTALGRTVAVEFNFTIMPTNYVELPKLIMLAARLGVDSVTTHRLAPDHLPFAPDDFLAAVTDAQERARELAKGLGVAFQPSRYRSQIDYHTKSRAVCAAVRDRFRLDCEGFLFAQCHAAQNPPTGNLLLNRLDEIVASPAFDAYRGCLDNPHPAQCERCLHFVTAEEQGHWADEAEGLL